MKSILPVVLLCWVWIQSYAQSIKEPDFGNKLFISAFSDSDKAVWPLKSTTSGTYYIQNGKYYLQAKGEEGSDFLFPAINSRAPAVQVSMRFKFDAFNDKNATAGIAIQVSKNKQSGYIAELNSKKQFRISVLGGDGKIQILTKGKHGWKSLTHWNAANTISLSYASGQLTFWANNKKEWQSPVKEVMTGQNGIYLSGQANVVVLSFSVFAADKKDSSREDKNNENNQADTFGMQQLQKAYQDMKSQFDAQQIELSQDKQKIVELQTFIQQNLDVKLQAEAARLKKENEKLRLKIKADSVTYAAVHQDDGTDETGKLINDLSLQVQSLTDENKKLKRNNSWLQSQLNACKKSNGQ